MNTLTSILISTGIISIIAFVGILTLYFKKDLIQKIIFWLVGLSTGALMGGAFLHLLPEASEKAEGTNINIFTWTLVAFIIFFVIEKILHWRHCHKENCPVHSFGYMNLIGDAVHNFIDGLIIAASFMVNPELGITTTIAIALHEIPQEIGDFGVLLYAGYKHKMALFYNFSVSITVVLGGIFGYFLSEKISESVVYLLPIAAGGFIYIAASDLIPELRKEKSLKKSLITFGFFLLGILIMYGVKFIG